ncbi:hypothetical protein F2P56_020767 [Juglans regia]|uniref:Protein IQ-DOMAIN 1-like n=2 Tax=Juglans regia TaxID=51240 RepID=A0A833UUT6_JUGRE|nr:hypothetical protein F2P56_020767 [Juglans regia]
MKHTSLFFLFVGTLAPRHEGYRDYLDLHWAYFPSSARSGSIPMDSGDWFRSIICIKRRKEDRSKQAKARKKLCQLKDTARFQSLIQDHTYMKQASTALSYTHSWCRIQDQIRTRRLRMVQEGRIRQKKSENQLKLEAKLHELEVEWCSGSQTMEEILSRIQQREVAAIKRERTMAYAFSHQWRANSSQYLGQASYNIGKENWGWSWMDRWIAARPWEVRVHSHSSDSNKVQTKQSTSYHVAKQPKRKLSVSVKPAISNGKGTTKAKDSVQTTAGR